MQVWPSHAHVSYRPRQYTRRFSRHVAARLICDAAKIGKPMTGTVTAPRDLACHYRHYDDFFRLRASLMLFHFPFISIHSSFLYWLAAG